MRRQHADDVAVTLHLPISERTEGDTRAIAVSYPLLSVDPTQVTRDLRHVRAAIKQALRAQRENPDASLQLLPLTPLTSKRALRRIAHAATTADANLSVFCSNLGDLGRLLYALARTDAEYATVSGVLIPLHLIRVTEQHATRKWLERAGGQLNLQCWRIAGRIAITVDAYQPGGENTKPALRELTARTLSEFGLTGDIG
jgi:hypothetical protein